MRPSGYVALVAGLVTLGGYSLMWYGGLMVQGHTGPGRKGPGLLDLILPSRIANVDRALAAAPATVGPKGQLPPGVSPSPGATVKPGATLIGV